MKTQFFNRLPLGWLEGYGAFRTKADVEIGVEKVLGVQDKPPGPVLYLI